jgi:actin-related protein
LFISKPAEHVLRMSLNMGGDDITEFLYVLLDRIKFPYRDINLARSYDWSLMEDLKARLCTLSEVSRHPFMLSKTKTIVDREMSH